jgi:hypothetical protein
MNNPSLADEKTLEATAAAVRARGIDVEIVSTKAEAFERIKSIIPAGVTVTTGASLTLKEIGFEDYLISKAHPWKNLKEAILAEKDPARQAELRRQSILADYFLGSVHAIVETGELVIASATGSQLGPYAYSARNVIWVAGAQKITKSLEDGIRRVKEYIMPHENERMMAMTGGKFGTILGKLLIIEREVPILGRKMTLILVREATGD